MLTEQNGIQVDKFYPPTDWQYSFPEGYTRLEYLEGTGTQWLNTGITASQDLRVRTKIYSKSTNNQSVFCTRSSQGSNNFALLLVSGYFRPCYNTTYSNSDLKYSINTLYDIDFNKNNFYVNGQLIKTFTYATFSNDVVMRIANSINAGEIYYIGRIYPYLIYNNDVLVANLIPVKRNSDGELGMLDLIQDTFRTNRGTGTFIAGPELYSNNSQIDIRQKNNTNFVEKYKFNENNELVWANPQLNLSGPVGYTKVGNPTIVDSVVSGFSDSNYLQINREFSNLSSFEIVCKFNLSTLTRFNTILSSSAFQLVIRVDENNTLRFLAMSSRTWDIANVNGTTVLSANTDYWVKLIFTGTQYILYLSLDGKNYSAEITVNSSLKIQTMPYIMIGRRGSASGHQFNGYIDLKETYVKVNDKLWFYGKNYTSENYAPVPAGLNYNNTTTPSIGYVNTQTQVFIPAPTDGIKYSQVRDIKVIPPEDNTITLLYGVKSDFSKYSLFGLLVNVSSGTYDVYIDDVLYATTASETQTDIDFSALGAEYISIGTCTTPEELVLHKIVIKPTTSEETITKFRCVKNTNDPNTTSRTQQGLMWYHLELTNSINLENCVAVYSSTTNSYYNPILYAVTCKGDILNFTHGAQYLVGAGTDHGGSGSKRIDYLPQLNTTGSSTPIGIQFGNSTTPTIKRIIYINKDTTFKIQYHSFRQDYNLEQICINNTKNISLGTNQLQYCFYNVYKLKQTLNKFIDFSNATRMDAFLSQASELFPEKLDLSSAKNLTILHTNGSSTYPMRGLRGLKVSNEAPFSATSSPQINVSYTGLDRDSLVELFESMPGYMKLDKVGEPTIDSNGVASGFSSSNYLELQNQITLSKDSNIEIIEKINKPSDKSSNSVIGTATGYGFALQGGSSGKLLLYIGNGSTWSVINGQVGTNILDTDTDYYIKIKISNGLFNVYISTDNINYTLDNSVDISALTTEQQYTLRLGMARNTANYFNGSIDLKNSYITINNARYQLQLPDDTTSRAINITAATGNNLTKTGNPIIDENGIASGFSASNYLQLNNFNNIETNNIELCIKYTPTTLTATRLLATADSGTTFTGIAVGNTSPNYFRFFVYGNNTQYVVVSSVTAQANTNYYIIAYRKGNKIGIKVSSDGINYTTDEISIPDNLSLTNANKLYFGLNKNSGASFINGSIDLNQSYIKVGQNYLMKGYLTDNDRLIATNKGWTITG